MLSKKGYDTYTNLSKLDSDDLLDMVEFETISMAVEGYEIKKAQNGNS